MINYFRFGSERKDGLNISGRFFPGPGNYDTLEGVGKRSAPKFSFPKTLKGDSTRPMTPGPGQYNYKMCIGKEGPKISIAPRSLSTSHSNMGLPGPGQYNISLVNKTKAPEYKMGTSSRAGFYKFHEDVPGPGQYSPAGENVSNRPKSPTYSIGLSKRPNYLASENNPGPGNYLNKSSVGEGPKVTIISNKISIL